jgi:hypothetical protein
MAIALTVTLTDDEALALDLIAAKVADLWVSQPLPLEALAAITEARAADMWILQLQTIDENVMKAAISAHTKLLEALEAAGVPSETR